MRQYRSFFWPGLLILIGVLALLANTNVISVERLDRLTDLWPVILVVIGLLLIVRRTPMPAATEAIAAGVILLLAVAGAVAYVAIEPAIPSGTQTLDAAQDSQGISRASVQIDAGGATVHVTGSTSLGSQLFRAHIVYSGSTPQVSFDRSAGHLEISQGSGALRLFTSQRFQLDLLVNSAAKWDVVIHAGGSDNTLNLANTKVGAIELDTGSSSDDITLGPPTGTVPIKINGGSLSVHIHRPAGSAAFVRAQGGSLSLDFDGRQTHAVGSIEAGSENQEDLYRVEINGGNCDVTMDTASPSG